MAEFTADIHEQILIRLDVKDLIRCKSVCKSWHSLISSQRFIRAHLNHSYNHDCKIGHRRIFMARLDGTKSIPLYEGDVTLFEHSNPFLIGSYNGLVCLVPFRTKPFVANPSTREVKKLQDLNIPKRFLCSSFCWGFGYDPSLEDYKVIVGFINDENRRCFQSLYLKSNVWKDIGEVNYEFISKIGTLCYGRLHWLIYNQNKKRVIISFDLSKEEFKEMPLPDDPIINHHDYIGLGVIKECLCIYQYQLPASSEKWVMKNNNVKQHWKRLPYDYEMEYDVVHYMRVWRGYIPLGEFLCHDDVCVSKSGAYIGSPIFVQSLVSPHVGERPKRKRQIENNKRSVKDVTCDHVTHAHAENEENKAHEQGPNLDAQLSSRPKRRIVIPARYREFVTNYGTGKEVE